MSDLISYSKSVFPDGRRMSRLIDSMMPQIIEAHERISIRQIRRWFAENKDIHISVNTLAKKIKRYQQIRDDLTI